MIIASIVVIIFLFGLYTYKVGNDVGGYVPFWRALLKSGPSKQVTIDLYIAITILCIWMVYDALEMGISLVWVGLYILVAVFMGSFGPLLYLLHRFLIV